MGKKLTPKQTKFAQKYLETGNASEAYRQAYNVKNMSEKTIGNEAYDLLQHPGVSPYVKRQQAKAQVAHEVTLSSITQELEDARLLGMTEKQTAAAISASMGKAKLHGLVVDKAQQDGDININITKRVVSARNTD